MTPGDYKRPYKRKETITPQTIHGPVRAKSILTLHTNPPYYHHLLTWERTAFLKIKWFLQPKQLPSSAQMDVLIAPVHSRMHLLRPTSIKPTPSPPVQNRMVCECRETLKSKSRSYTTNAPLPMPPAREDSTFSEVAR